MEKNHTQEAEFILTSFTGNPELRLPLLLTILVVNLLTVVGNLGMNILILFRSELHTPCVIFSAACSFCSLLSNVSPLSLLSIFWKAS